MTGIIALTLIILAALVYHLRMRATKEIDGIVDEIAKDTMRVIKEEEEEKKKEEKKHRFDRGNFFPIEVDCYIIDSFFNKDTKFFCCVPRIDNKYVQFPGIVEVGDNKEMIWESEKIDEEVFKQSTEIYKRFYSKNKERFV